jgi:hypothetical protein
MRSELGGKLALVDVVGPPAAVLSVDGHRSGVLPLARPLALDPGERSIRVEANGQTVTDKRLQLGEGTTLRLVVEVAPPAASPLVSVLPPRETERPSVFGRWWFWTATAAVAVGGALGIAAAAGGFSRAAGCPPERRCM